MTGRVRSHPLDARGCRPLPSTAQIATRKLRAHCDRRWKDLKTSGRRAELLGHYGELRSQLLGQVLIPVPRGHRQSPRRRAPPPFQPRLRSAPCSVRRSWNTRRRPPESGSLEPRRPCAPARLSGHTRRRTGRGIAWGPGNGVPALPDRRRAQVPVVPPSRRSLSKSWRTLDSAGVVSAPASVSSKPTIAWSRGSTSPAAWRTRMTPMAL